MYKIIQITLFLVLSLSFFSCAKVQNVAKPYEKAFDGEDRYIVFALRAEEIGDHTTASKLFYKLYEKSSKKEYLYRAMQNQIMSKDYNGLIKYADKVLDTTFNDLEVERLKVVALAESGKLKDAEKLSLELAKKSSNSRDYMLVSDIYVKESKYNMALKYLEGAYVKDYDEKILDKMSIVLYVNLDRKKDAIAELESYIRVHGCSKRICVRLISFYSDQNNIDGLLSIYLRLYWYAKHDDVAKKIIQIYAYKKDYMSMMDFLENSGADDTTLLELYINLKDYKKASVLAAKLYEKTSDVRYLGESAIYQYEANSKKIDKKTLDEIVKKLREVVKQSDSTLYKNYLGYLLIDHNIDIKGGIKYIKEVLKVKSDSAYYLDSLAWGYYKLGYCKKAKRIMDKVKNLEGGDNPEVVSHIRAINRCIRKKKR